jgi:hypothetical protein
VGTLVAELAVHTQRSLAQEAQALASEWRQLAVQALTCVEKALRATP